MRRPRNIIFFSNQTIVVCNNSRNSNSCRAHNASVQCVCADTLRPTIWAGKNRWIGHSQLTFFYDPIEVTPKMWSLSQRKTLFFLHHSHHLKIVFTNCNAFSIDDEICNDVWVIFFLDQTLVGFLFVVAAMITNCRVKNLGNYLALLLQEER